MIPSFRSCQSGRRPPSWLSVVVVPSLILLAPSARSGAADLSTLSIEDLMKIEVTSVSKRAQPLSEAAAAVCVITNEDIRRSGATSVAEALRLAPGLHVARIDGSRWAITSRGFNMQFANKLLVLIDGRSVYTHLFSGVYWDVQDLVLEDIDRIEVVRGPGGTLWGANAVNGVINIITKKARDTQGWLASGGAGTLERDFGTLRYGAALGENAHVRGYVKYLDHGSLETAVGKDPSDARGMTRGGFRMDWDPSPSDAFTLQGDFYDGGVGIEVLTMVPDEEDLGGANVLGRWRHVFSETSDLSIQTYYDRTERVSGAILGEDRDTYDIELEHRFRFASLHDVIWGAGYRLLNDRTRGGIVTFTPWKRTDNLLSAFVQDQIRLLDDRLQLTVGSKFEHNDYTGLEVQPTARALYKLAPRHSIWTAVSRAVRTPSRTDDDINFFGINVDPPLIYYAEGHRNFDSEKLLAYEIGYRGLLSERFSMDLTAYYHDYDDLRGAKLGSVPLPTPPFPPGTVRALFDNDTDAVGYGVELGANWNVTDRWAVSGWYTLMKLDVDADPANADVVDKGQEDDTPTNQVHFRSHLSLPWDLEFDTHLFYVGEVSHQQAGEYTRLDLRLGWRPIESVELSVAGQNLTERRHEEFGTGLFGFSSSVPRALYGKVTWRY